ncbi:hypothetical protein EDB19DRAFT_2037554 [Suillus lakei]|nr:hypothetical protein EDB19DRAFT_2037554 [Suillus lakei]
MHSSLVSSAVCNQTSAHSFFNFIPQPSSELSIVELIETSIYPSRLRDASYFGGLVVSRPRPCHDLQALIQIFPVFSVGPLHHITTFVDE